MRVLPAATATLLAVAEVVARHLEVNDEDESAAKLRELIGDIKLELASVGKPSRGENDGSV